MTVKQKYLIVIFLIFIGETTISSQTVNNIPIKDIQAEYVQIIGTAKFLSKKVTIRIDFGQNVKFFSSGKETKIKDQNGKSLILNSMIDALNFMNSNDYKFVQAYAISIGNQNVYHYLLKKEKTK